MNIFPVIHYLSENQAKHNIELAKKYNCKGVFLIDMHGTHQKETLELAIQFSHQYPELEIGVNHLGHSALTALQMNIEAGLSMTWTDKCLTHTTINNYAKENEAITSILKNNEHTLFSAVAFKYQPDEPNPALAALKALELGYIPTTSGIATGKSISIQKLEDIRSVIGLEARLTVASGVTPDNISQIKNLVTDVLVASSIITERTEMIIESELANLVNNSF